MPLPGQPKPTKTLGHRHYSTSARAAPGQEKEEVAKDTPKRVMEESEVPTGRISRLLHYTSLAATLTAGAASESISRTVSGKSTGSSYLSEANIQRLTKKLSKMRGAALKLGQMMSFQDQSVLPHDLYTVLSRVQNCAHYMPQYQLDKVLTAEFGENWSDKFASFNKIPIAAASIGQVHHATLQSGEKVVVKVQYPGVKDSIDSDLSNLLMLLTASRLLPKGLFLDKTVANARKELKWECDYVREAEALRKFRTLLKDDPVFVVPKVYDEFTTGNVITMERMDGNVITEAADQETRDFIASNIMRLCLMEIAEFKYMQTDPNWANFLYNNGKIELLDFGASRGFPDEFITKYMGLLKASVNRDRKEVAKMSVDLGYLTGLESKAMVDAHVDSVMALGEPFMGTGLYDFTNQDVTDRIRGNIGLMLNERLSPPPEETYSLHRKFSGVFLLCARLGAKVPCAEYFEKSFK